MISFRKYVKDIYGEDLVGIYPPLYGPGQYPASYFTTYTPYIDASIKSLKRKKSKKRKKYKK
jgi:hypothetical protein